MRQHDYRSHRQSTRAFAQFRNSDVYLLERRKQKMLRAVEGWSPSWLTYAPSATDWSNDLRPSRKNRTCRAYLLRGAVESTCRAAIHRRETFRFPIRVRVPQTVEFVKPLAPSSHDELTRTWAEERMKLGAFLVRKDSLPLDATAMRHPAIGALSLRDALRSLVVHLWHHEFQLRRLRGAIAKVYL